MKKKVYKSRRLKLSECAPTVEAPCCKTEGSYIRVHTTCGLGKVALLDGVEEPQHALDVLSLGSTILILFILIIIQLDDS